MKPRTPKYQRFIDASEKLIASGQVKSERKFLENISANNTLFSNLRQGRHSVTEEIIKKAAELYPEYFDADYIITGRTPEPYLVTARILGPLSDYEFIELPLLDAHAMAGFSDNIYGDMYKLETGKTYPVLKIQGRNYEKSMVMDIVGDSMVPTFRNGMKVIVREVPEGKWATVTGIHAISIKGGMFTLKRITKNKGNLLTLKADNKEYPDELEIQVADILALFRVGEIVSSLPMQ